MGGDWAWASLEKGREGGTEGRRKREDSSGLGAKTGLCVDIVEYQKTTLA